MELVGDKIHKLRKQMGLSQEELAFKIGVSRQTVSKWESNAMNPNMDSIQALCNIFNVKADYFLLKEETLFEDKDVIGSDQFNDEVSLATSTQKENRQTRKLSICIIVLSIVVCLFVSVTVIVGFNSLTTNQGDVVCVTSQIDLWGFIALVVIDMILLIVDFCCVLIRYRRKKYM